MHDLHAFPATTTARLNVAGLLLTAAGMLLQMAAGSDLYPTFTGPIVLLVTAVTVTVWSGRWTTYVGLLVPLALGLGAIIAAAMTGEFVDQLTGVDQPGVLTGSVVHVIGLTVAISGGVGMLLDRPAQRAAGVASP